MMPQRLFPTFITSFASSEKQKKFATIFSSTLNLHKLNNTSFFFHTHFRWPHPNQECLHGQTKDVYFGSLCASQLTTTKFLHLLSSKISGSNFEVKERKRTTDHTTSFSKGNFYFYSYSMQFLSNQHCYWPLPIRALKERFPEKLHLELHNFNAHFCKLVENSIIKGYIYDCL